MYLEFGLLDCLLNCKLKWKEYLSCAFFLCVSGQSVHLGMGGSWSRAVPRHLWTLCHILPGLLCLLLHWRVSREHFCSIHHHVSETTDTWRESFKSFLSLSLLFSRGFAVTLLYGKINSEKHLEKCEQSYLPPTQIGILKVHTHTHTHSLTSPTN